MHKDRSLYCYSKDMIRLRPPEPSDLAYFQVWWRDKELIALTSGDFRELSDKQVKAYFDDILRQKNSIHRMIETDDKKVIGHMALNKRRDGWYETQIVLGDKLTRGKGNGPVAIQQIIQLAEKLNIAKIYLEVRPENTRAIKAYQKAGFHIVGKFETNNALQPSLIRMELR